MAKGAINVKIEGEYTDKDIKRAIKDLESLKTQGAPAAKSVGGLTTAFKGMALAAGAFVSVSAVKDFIGDAISGGSDLQESLSKTSAVFGDNADAVIRWSENSATAFGQSKQQALEAAGTFGNLLIAFGSTTDEAQVMSQRMVELAADLASFNNTSVDDALNALRSGLSGETEPLKRFGVAINDARLKTVALEKGLYSGKGTLDTYAKSVAAYELILKDTTLAQGDFARTSDGLANQQRILESTFTNLQTALGSGIIDGFGDLGDNGQTMVDAMEALQPALEGIGYWIGESGQDYLFLVAQTAALVSELHNLVPTLGDTSEEASLTDQALGQLGNVFSLTTGSAGFLSGALQELQGTVLRKASDSLDGAGVSARAVAGELKNMAESADDAADDTMSAEEALKALKDQVNALKGAISDRQAMDDFRKSLRDLGETLKDNERTFKGMGDAALENRETLRTAFSDAADIVQGWVESGKISADQFQTKYDGLAKKIVAQFVADGFKRKDVERFLATEGIWVSQLRQLSSTVTDESKKLGFNASQGIAQGVKDGQSLVATAMSGTVLAAIQAGKSVAKIKSPSQVTRDQVGIPLIDGVIAGMNVKKDELKATSQSLIGEAIGVIETELQDFDNKIKDAFDKMEADKTAISTWVASTRDALISAFDLTGVFESSVDDQGRMTVSTFQAGIDAGLAQFQWYNNVLTAIAQTPGSEQLVAFLQGQGVTNGGAWGQALIDNGLVQYMIDNLKTVTDTSDATAQAMVPGFLASAQASSSALYDQVVKDYGKDGEKRKKLEALMTRLARALDRTSTITIRTVYESVGLDGKRAAGGPVSANKAYLVGERGPEVLVMGGQSGTIIPNADLPMASGGVMGGDGAAMGGATYNITVQAGVGDPRQIGQQVVEYIKKFESSNGRVFAAA